MNLLAIRLAIRHLFRGRGYTILNLLGLAIGIAGAMLLTTHVRTDLMWDGFHERAERIVRLQQVQTFGGIAPQHVAYTSIPIAPVMEEEIPEVVETVRMTNAGSPVMRRGETIRYERDTWLADSSFFQVFSYPLIAGDPATALSEPNSIVLRKDVAEAYFGDEDPLGQTLEVRGQRTAVVTGVLGMPPGPSHLEIRALMPFDAIFVDFGAHVEQMRNSWGSNLLATYALLEKGTSVEAVEAKLPEFFEQHRNMDGIEYYLKPLREIHLESGHVKYDINSNPGSWDDLRTLATLAILMVLIASINTMNLTTARAMRRAREVGLRKVVGAGRGQLVAQFFGEALMLSVMAGLVALALVELLEPTFAQLAGRVTDVNVLDGGFGTFLFTGLVLASAALTGLYPALFLASFRPMSVLRGRLDTKPGGAWLRRGLVVLQFAASIVLVIATITVMRQLHYSHNKELGYARDQVVVIPCNEDNFWDNEEAFKERLLRVDGVEAVSASSTAPTYGGGQGSAEVEGFEDPWLFTDYFTDPGALETYGYEMAQGRFFSEEHPSDFASEENPEGACVINEAALREIGWDDPIGKRIHFRGLDLTVIGVLRDFHVTSLRSPIEPLIMTWAEGEPKAFLSLRLSGDPREVVDRVEKTWRAMLPSVPFRFVFHDERYEQMYRQEIQLGQILQTFSALTVFIASLGLLGLAAHAAQRRTKEISVRKVLGANTRQILALLTSEFAVLILVANLIAWPAAFFLLRDWLQQFAYRADMPLWAFPLAGASALIVALVTVSWNALKAANTNPAVALHDE